MRREFDRMLEEFPWGWRRPLARGLFDVEPFFRGFAGVGAIPAVDIAEKDKEYEITAELPGMDESNIDVKFADGVLTIKGEKREEKEEKKKDYYLSERRYGSFQRSFPVPESVDADKIEAKFVERRAHGKIAQERRGTEEREEDRHQEGLGARHRAHLSCGEIRSGRLSLLADERSGEVRVTERGAPARASALNASVLAALARKEDSKPRPLRNG